MDVAPCPLWKDFSADHRKSKLTAAVANAESDLTTDAGM